jgi:hypothetical protein
MRPYKNPGGGRVKRNSLEDRGSHTVDDIANGSNTCATDGPLIEIHGRGLSVKPPEERIGPNVKDRVNRS